MMRHLVFLLGAITLLKGALSLSPIPVPEQEWEEFNALLRNPAYRLPTTTVPDHYEVSLTPYFDTGDERAFTFEGNVRIKIHANVEEGTPVNEIVMHCNDLTVLRVTVQYTNNNNQNQEIASPDQVLFCEMPYSFLKIATIEPLQRDVTYEVFIEFTGHLQTNMRGFYRSWYTDETTRRWMATTQFQPGHARQAFPCYDEPGFKATFDITINREPTFSSSISNMPIKATSDTLVPGRVSETFHTTPKTSTYLLAFIVSHYVVVAESKENPDRPFKIYARNNVGSTGEWSLEVGKNLLRVMEEYTDIPYYQMAPYLDMKQAAIPDFSAGAMENWGLLTYREALILYDPENSNHFYKQRVANIVAHEIAHMWFGNLVTCAWWDNLWLNEGFARFYQYFLTAKVASDLGYETRFITEQFQQAMTADSVDSAHALTNPVVNDPATVSAHFSAITYARGACIIKMTQHLLTENTFVKGLRRYLKNRQFNVAEPHHLFEALDAAATEDGALTAYSGITIDRYFKTWSEKAGHPLLTVTINQETGEMTVHQARWERDTGVSDHSGVWDIPITWTRAGAADFEDLKPSQFIIEENTVIQRGSTGREWVVFNKQASGFYRVNYDRVNWALITQALRSNVEDIHEYNRAQMIDDLFSFGRAGVIPYERVFNIMSFLEFDSSYAAWINAIDGFNFLIRRVAHDEANFNRLKAMIINLSKAVSARLGYADIRDESYMDGLLRMYVMQFLCNVGEEQCINTGKEHFTAWRNGDFVPANMRPWVYCVGLREGTAADFDYFWNRYLDEDLASEQVVMLQSAGCTTDNVSLEKLLDAIADSEEIVRPQDLTTALSSAVTRNEINTLRALEWLKKNIEKTTNKFGSISTHLSYIIPRLLTSDDINELEAWLEANRILIGDSAYNTGVTGVRNVRNNLEWSNKRIPELEQFFDTGYIDEQIDPTEVPTDPTEPPVGPTEVPIDPTDPPIDPTEPPVDTTEPPVDPTEPPVDTTEPPVDPTEPPVDPTEPPVDPTEPPVDPTEPPVDPTEPPVDPTEPPVDPTEPPVDPTEPPVDPTEEPTTPADEDGGAATIALSIVALIVSLVTTFLN